MLKDNSKIHVLFCCNPEYFQHLSVALVSLLDNNKCANFGVHVICSREQKEVKEKLLKSLSFYYNYNIHFYVFEIDKYQHFFTGDAHVSLETYLRIFAAEVLPDNIEKVLYLDADLVVVDDVRPLWHICLDNHVLAAVKDPYGYFRRAELRIPREFTYVNAGVLLMNLKKWREMNLIPKLVSFIESSGESLTFWDQDAINAVLYSKITVLSYRWNLQARMFRSVADINCEDQEEIYSARNNPAIIHYSSYHKPWIYSVFVVPMSSLYYKYLEQTEWNGAPKQGFTWYKVPEHYICHLLHRCGFGYTFYEKYDNSFMRGMRRVLRSVIGVTRLLHENRKKSAA